MKITSSFEEFIRYAAKSGSLYATQQFSFQGTAPNFNLNNNISKISQNQVRYLEGLDFTQGLMAAKCDFIQVSIALSGGDSKDIFCSHDMKLVYDADPRWLSSYIPLLLDIQKLQNRKHDALNIIACGGLLSFSHFCGRNLLGITLCASLGIDIPILLPFEQDWQTKLIELFSRQRTYWRNTGIDSSFLNPQIKVFNCMRSWIIEEPTNWDSLYQLRKLFQHNSVAWESTLRASSRIYLSRYRHEVLGNAVGRVSNALRVQKIAKSYGFTTFFPEATDLAVVSETLLNAQLILCDPGSVFMNYMLFSNNNAKVFQLIPEPWLRERESALFNSQFQWYLPLIKNIIFVPSDPIPGMENLTGDQLVPDIPFSYSEERLIALLRNHVL